MHMADAKTFVVNAPAWVDLSSTDPKASRDYYSKLFGWKVEVEPDPKAGGYALAKQDGKDVAGIGGTQNPNGPSAWMVYIGTKDADALAKKVEAAGGKVIAPPFAVLKSGRMAVFQDPSGAFISAWEPNEMHGMEVIRKPNTYGWAELNARGIEQAKQFYTKVFGWGAQKSPMGQAQGESTEHKPERAGRKARRFFYLDVVEEGPSGREMAGRQACRTNPAPRARRGPAGRYAHG